MDTVACKLKIGSWEIDTSEDPRTEFLRLVVERGMNSPLGLCEVSLYVTPAPKPGLLEAAAGAAASALGFGGDSGSAAKFSLDVRGLPVAQDDPMEITLMAGDRNAKVMRATVERIMSHQGRVRISGCPVLQTCARSRSDLVFVNQDAGRIARDLASAAGVSTGQIDAGDTYPYFVADAGRSVFDHLLALAELEGMDLYDDPDGAVVMRRYNKTQADRKLYYGTHLLNAQIHHNVAPYARVQITGEGPASSGGSEKWHHLMKQPAAQSAAGSGAAAVRLVRAAARSLDAAKRVAKGRLGAALDAATHGTLRLLGDPTLAPGDAVEVLEAPWPEVNGTYKVNGVRHRLVKNEGFVTTLSVTGMGGGAAAEDQLGKAMAAVGGLL